MAALQSVYSVYINFSTLQLALLLVFLSSSAQAETNPKPQLMLANTYHNNIKLEDYWVSEKFDGVRAYWDGKTLLSRQGNVYHAPPWFTAQFPAIPLDGELWLGRQRFDELSGAVRKDTPDESEWREIRFMVFDAPAAEGSFDQRLNKLESIISQSQSPYLVLVAQQKFRDEKTLMAHLNALVAVGAEGLILHLGSAPYRSQRSDDLLKLKLYQDAEATVIGHIGGKGKYKGMLGSLLVETGDGIKFKIGSGFSDAQRQSPPAIGTTITYKYYGLTGSGTPRFASFLRIREEQ